MPLIIFLCLSFYFNFLSQEKFSNHADRGKFLDERGKILPPEKIESISLRMRMCAKRISNYNLPATFLICQLIKKRFKLFSYYSKSA